MNPVTLIEFALKDFRMRVMEASQTISWRRIAPLAKRSARPTRGLLPLVARRAEMVHAEGGRLKRSTGNPRAVPFGGFVGSPYVRPPHRIIYGLGVPGRRLRVLHRRLRGIA